LSMSAVLQHNFPPGSSPHEIFKISKSIWSFPRFFSRCWFIVIRCNHMLIYSFTHSLTHNRPILIWSFVLPPVQRVTFRIGARREVISPKEARRNQKL
jgi:hypothetical protein